MKSAVIATVCFLAATPAFAADATPEQDAVNMLGALSVVCKYMPASIGAYAGDVGQKSTALQKSIEGMQSDAEAKAKWWGEYVKGLEHNAPK